MTPSDTQAAAIRRIVDWYRDPHGSQEFYLAGYAGVGKSTIANIAIEELREHAGVQTVRTGTFTGKAANVLRKKGVHDARTIHSMTYVPKEDPDTGKVRFIWASEAPASEADLIVLDEVSMVSKELADDLRRFKKRMLVMGDPGQLPPVSGQGAFTNREPDVFLTEVHRQAADSPILRLATLARQGKELPLGQWEDAEGNITAVLPHTTDNQSNLYREETQPICGIHRVRFGYTGRIRARRGFGGPRPQVGETLICCRNDKDLGIFNGGIGTLLAPVKPLVDGVHWRIDVAMEDLGAPLKGIAVNPWMFAQHANPNATRPPRVDKGIQEFDFGYVLTCHKAQGSEWEDVTVVDDGGAFKADQHKWRYTACTRASKRLTFLRRMG